VPQLRHHRNAEREHILRVLEQSGLVVGGPHGAAVLLGLERTLLSIMRRLGIVRPQLRSGGRSAESGTPS
jgi:transcriptional regulator with GAF, ATPase, and Fis domain